MIIQNKMNIIIENLITDQYVKFVEHLSFTPNYPRRGHDECLFQKISTPRTTIHHNKLS